MTTSPEWESTSTEPPWIVQAVFDPDGEGSDFAYTIGLAELGLPELHIWARPSLGDDPGLDWRFTPRDLCGILNLLGGLLVDGELDVGSTLRRSADGGLATVELRVDPPGDREELGAYGVADGADVLPVRWSLSRPPIGPPRPVGDSVASAARERYDDLRARLQGTVSLPRGWALPDEPSFEVDQRLGPFTPLVLARAAHLGQADANTLADFLAVAELLDETGALSEPIVRGRALGRPVGRTEAFEQLHHFVDQLLDHWGKEFVSRRRWKAVVEQFYAPPPPDRRITRAEVDRQLRTLLHSAVEACLAGEVAFDVADEKLRLCSAGPWQAATTPDGRPGPEWHAPDEVLLRVQELVHTLSADQVRRIAVAHQRAVAVVTRRPSTTVRYGELVARLDALSLVSRAVLPPVLVTARPPGGPVSVPMTLDQVPVLGALFTDWLQCVTALLAHRARLPVQDIETFAEPFAEVVPDLGEMLASPL
ncbi:MAG: hypothetical protein ACOYX5_09885 [Actinomycetota bacterium]